MIFFVGGYLGRSLNKKTTCKECQQLLLLDGSMEELSLSDAEEETQNISQFVDQINRGGLQKPTELLFLTCLHVWILYEEMISDEFAKDILSSAKVPREVFSKAAEKYFVEEWPFLEMQKCRNGHSFMSTRKQIFKRLHNLFSKNEIAKKNAEIRKEKKHKSSGGPDGNARKIKKLQSDNKG